MVHSFLSSSQCFKGCFQVSGTRYISSFPLILSHFRTPVFHGPRGTNVLDGGAPFYDTYTCKDGRWMSVGCIEPHFFEIFLQTFMKALPNNFDPCQGWRPEPSTQFKRQDWARLGVYLTKGFLTQPRDFWAQVFLGRFFLESEDEFQPHSLGTDSCAVPVLSPEEAGHESSVIPLPHPRISGVAKAMDQAIVDYPMINPGAHTIEVLKDFGIREEHIRKLRREGVFGDTLRHKSKL